MTGAHVVVAVDGPAGSGKSSVSRAAAEYLDLDYQDTGAAYRALAWLALERGVDPDDPDAVDRAARRLRLRARHRPDHYFVRVGGRDVPEAIREPRVSAVVSSIARIPAVRSYLVDLFRGVIAASTRRGIVTEGRDITTVVAPDAAVRILLTASAEARMARRSAQAPEQSAAAVAERLASRDARDMKVVDFMTAAPGVTTLDSTDLDFDQTVQAVVDLIVAASQREWVQ